MVPVLVARMSTSSIGTRFRLNADTVSVLVTEGIAPVAGTPLHGAAAGTRSLIDVGVAPPTIVVSLVVLNSTVRGVVIPAALYAETTSDQSIRSVES